MLANFIKKLPSTLENLADNRLSGLENILKNLSSNLIGITPIKIIASYTESDYLKKIKETVKAARQLVKNKCVNSDSVVALAVLYKVLTAAIDFKEPKENEGQIKKLFKAFAKWFNKYVSPRSSIRSPKVIEALNDTVGKMAGGGDMFKCGKLIRAKNAIKKIAKKG